MHINKYYLQLMEYSRKDSNVHISQSLESFKFQYKKLIELQMCSRELIFINSALKS